MKPRSRILHRFSAKNSTNDHAFQPSALFLRAAFRIASAASPNIAAHAASRLFLTPRQSPVREDERAVLARALRFSVMVRGRCVEGYSWGTGPAVLLAHGWEGHAGHMTAFVRPLNKAGFRAIAIDMPAHGQSDGRRSSLVHFAAAINAANELFGPFHGFIGHSAGAGAGVNALASGFDARRAVLIAPPARLDTATVAFQSATGLSDAVMAKVTARTERALKTRLETVNPIRSAGLVKIPVLVTHAPEDTKIGFEEGAELASMFTESTFMAAPGMGHLRILKDWRTIQEAVSFLKAEPREAGRAKGAASGLYPRPVNAQR